MGRLAEGQRKRLRAAALSLAREQRGVSSLPAELSGRILALCLLDRREADCMVQDGGAGSKGFGRTVLSVCTLPAITGLAAERWSQRQDLPCKPGPCRRRRRHVTYFALQWQVPRRHSALRLTQAQKQRER